MSAFKVRQLSEPLMSKESKNKIIKNHSVLVVVAHPDDEALALGGTIAKHVENGDIVYCMSLTDGVGARAGQRGDEIKARVTASIKAGEKLGLKWIARGNFPDNAMDTTPLLAIVKEIEEVKSKCKPTVVYTHSSADLNIDHRLTSQATLTAFRPVPEEICKEIRVFETVSATEYGHKSVTNLFIPNLYIDIRNTWHKKLAALNEYKMEMREAPHARSFEGIENLAKYRGSQVGLYYAEAFEIIRKVEI